MGGRWLCTRRGWGGGGEDLESSEVVGADFARGLALVFSATTLEKQCDEKKSLAFMIGVEKCLVLLVARWGSSIRMSDARFDIGVGDVEDDRRGV